VKTFHYKMILGGLVLSACAATLPAAEETASDSKTFLEMLQYGWEINVVLGGLTFLLLFMLFHTILTTRTQRMVPPDLLRRVLDDLAAGDVEAAQKKVMVQPCLLSQTILPGMKLHNHPLERIHAAMESAGRRGIGTIRQHVNYMANIGVLSPMLGLLGTVLGLLKAFNVMGAEQLAEGSKSILMTGAIGEAMITTAVGLLVGIPAMALHFLCLSRVGRISDEVESAAEEVSAALAELHMAGFSHGDRKNDRDNLTTASGFMPLHQHNPSTTETTQLISSSVQGETR